MKAGVVILAGGKGIRMGGEIPKQFQMLQGKPVALHSMHTFEQIDAVAEIVVVSDPSFRSLFSSPKP
jgi:2-C-methyl-D-erythritol 4-phosphate cytidylyltransferase